MITHYDWSGGREALIRFGPASGPVIIAICPLFEEANRTRTLLVQVLRALAARGVASLLPDVPGQGESLVATSDISLSHIRIALSAIDADYSISIRSGALLDTAPRKGRWQFAPQTGDELLRELGRIAPLSGDQAYAGNLIPESFLAELKGTQLPHGRSVRLESDPRIADLKISGIAPWRRAEPTEDTALVQRLVDDIFGWITKCGR